MAETAVKYFHEMVVEYSNVENILTPTYKEEVMHISIGSKNWDEFYSFNKALKMFYDNLYGMYDQKIPRHEIIYVDYRGREIVQHPLNRAITMIQHNFSFNYKILN